MTEFDASNPNQSDNPVNPAVVKLIGILQAQEPVVAPQPTPIEAPIGSTLTTTGIDTQEMAVEELPVAPVIPISHARSKNTLRRGAALIGVAAASLAIALTVSKGESAPAPRAAEIAARPHQPKPDKAPVIKSRMKSAAGHKAETKAKHRKPEADAKPKAHQTGAVSAVAVAAVVSTPESVPTSAAPIKQTAPHAEKPQPKPEPVATSRESEPATPAATGGAGVIIDSEKSGGAPSVATPIPHKSGGTAIPG